MAKRPINSFFSGFRDSLYNQFGSYQVEDYAIPLLPEGCRTLCLHISDKKAELRQARKYYHIARQRDRPVSLLAEPKLPVVKEPDETFFARLFNRYRVSKLKIPRQRINRLQISARNDFRTAELELHYLADLLEVLPRSQIKFKSPDDE